MISPTGDSNATLRKAYFLKPCINLVQDPNFEFPFLPIPPNTNSSEVETLPLKVRYRGRNFPQKNWKEWVSQLHSRHQSTWKKAGIHEAILSSTYRVQRHNELVLEVAERWCSETNSFLFPWGAATITLEDMIVLGGYSVLGCSVSKHLETNDAAKVNDSLTEAYRQISVARMVTHCAWMDYFMGTGHELEHQAFLSLWLSRYVFPGYVAYRVRKHIFPIAVRLASGIMIALAPAVLASIYRDLRLLRDTIGAARFIASKDNTNSRALDLWAPFQLVQLWVWERFPALRPKPNFVEHMGEPRVARWHTVKKLNTKKVRFLINSAGDSFQWRPYASVSANSLSRKLYRDQGEWVSTGPNLDEELESFARCLRPSELAGLECIEQYLPHRVAMQFGMDQDIPEYVPRFNMSHQTAWNNYCRPITYRKLYIPPRLFESDVTNRYLEWWKRSTTAQKDAIKAFVRRPRNTRRLPRVYSGTIKDYHCSVASGSFLDCQKEDKEESVQEAKDTLAGTLSAPSNVDNKLGADVKPFLDSFRQSISRSIANDGAAEKNLLMMTTAKIVQSGGSTGEPRKNLADATVIEVACPEKLTVLEENTSEEIQLTSIEKKRGNESDVPPGIPAKCKKVKLENPLNENASADEGMLSYGMHDCLAIGPSDDGKHFWELSSSFSASATDGALQKMDHMIRPEEKLKGGGEASIESLARALEGTIKCINGTQIHNGVSIYGGEGEDSIYTPEVPGLDLESRISRLERVVAELKKRRFEEIPTPESWSAP